MLITLDEYEEGIHTYYICDCVVRDRNMFTFIADSWYTDEEVEEEEREGWDPSFRPKRILPFFRDDPEGDRLGWETLNDWGHIEGGAALLPINQFVGIERENDRVYISGGGEVYEDTPLTNALPNNPLRGGIRRVKTLGEYVYICGGNRSFGKRLGKGEWFSHNAGFPETAGTNNNEGFEDFDGFSEDDIYAAGGKGDVWHFNGQKWRQIPFPTNAWVKAVCCGGDGNVYISCYEGLTFMGRENRWKKIHNGGIYLGWRDMVWYEDRVWCSNDNGLWTIRNGRVEYQRDLPSEISVCSGHLYTNDGVLLMAGMGGAAFLENGQWQVIFLRGEMEKRLRDK
ncbi:MAG: hypothetical protein MI754_01610 [Chromatiales bacterium]|nr:hypothetical protein [Chromatiales bacterium]